MDFEILLRDGSGPLRTEFEALGPVAVWDEERPLARLARTAAPWTWSTSLLEHRIRSHRSEQLRRRYSRSGVELIYSNTITNGNVLAALAPLGRPVISHVHELDYWVQHRLDASRLKEAQACTRHYIAVSQAVKRMLIDVLGVDASQIDLVHGFVRIERDTRSGAGLRVRKQLDLPLGSRVVGGCGTIDWRKGPELFVQLARAVVTRSSQPVHFVWVGGERTGPVAAALNHDVMRAGLNGHVHFIGEQPNPLDYFAAFDVFTLVSREDPFPLVVLEAASLGKPVVCFDGSGGAREFVEHGCGFIVPYLDIESMADRVLALLDSPDLCARLGAQAARRVSEQHAIDVVAPRLLEIADRFLSRPHVA